VQEALTNTLKHAGAGAEAHVTLTFTPDGVDIEVVDSGPERSSPAPEGVGLRGMRERAAVYDGLVEAGPLDSALRAGASGFLLKDAQPADELVLSEATVKTHVGRILAKHELRDRVQIVVYAYERGLVAPAP
jgi:DNA-binding CsgD family transcriptional regulator